MSQIKKHTWKGLVTVAAMLLSVGLMTQTVFAAVAITTPAAGSVQLSTAATGGTDAFTALSTNLVLTESAAAQFAVGNTVILNAPTGWVFDAAVAPTAVGTNTLAATTAATTTTYTVTISAASVGTAGVLTVSNIRVKPTTTTSPTGVITASGTQAGTATITAGATLGTITAVPGFVSGPGTGAKLILFVSIPASGDTSNIRADGTTAITLTAALGIDTDGNNVISTAECNANPQFQGAIVQWTTSRGTLSSTVSTTTSTSSQTGATCTSTVPFRGNGTTGSANITAVVTQPVPLVATATLTVTAGTITPTQIAFRDTTNSGHVAASIETQYVTTNNIAQVRFRVTNGADQGSNGQVVQATVDKGNIGAWVDTNADGDVDPGEVVACTDNVTTTFTTKQNKIDGTDVEGIAVFFVCAKSGQAAGPIKVTAKNLTTTMSDATTTVTSAGIPNKIETVVAGNTVTVTVKDKDGNNVAENTPVTFQVPGFTGTVAPACALTSGGKASASAAFGGISGGVTGGQILVTVFHNSSGAAAGCPAGGNTVGATGTVNVGVGGGTTPGGTGAGFVGTSPARGSIGLLVTAGSTNAASLVSALAAAGCTVESIAVLEGGVWKIYINGAPVVVNAAFPGTVGATVAFFVRCAA